MKLIRCAVTLVQDQQNGDVDFGVTPTPTDPQNNASIGDLVFEDLDGDGAFGTGEPGLAGINLALFQGSTEIATQTTASDGSYLFDNLAAGSYRVELLTDSLGEREVTTASAFDVTLAQDENNDDIDFGVATQDEVPFEPEFDDIRGEFTKQYTSSEFVAVAASLSDSLPVVTESFTIVDTGSRKLAFQSVGVPGFGGIPGVSKLRLLAALPGSLTVEQIEDNFGNNSSTLSGLGLIGDLSVHTVSSDDLAPGIISPVAPQTDVLIATTGGFSTIIGTADQPSGDPNLLADFNPQTVPLASNLAQNVITVSGLQQAYVSILLDESFDGLQSQVLEKLGADIGSGGFGYATNRALNITTGIEQLGEKNARYVYKQLIKGTYQAVPGYSKLVKNIVEINLDNPSSGLESNLAFQLRQQFLYLEKQGKGFTPASFVFEDNPADYDVDLGILNPAGSQLKYATAIQFKGANFANMGSKLRSRQLEDAPGNEKVFQVMVRDSTGDKEADIASVEASNLYQENLNALKSEGIKVVITDFNGNILIEESP